jgi:hypothetical protein
LNSFEHKFGDQSQPLNNFEMIIYLLNNDIIDLANNSFLFAHMTAMDWQINGQDAANRFVEAMQHAGVNKHQLDANNSTACFVLRRLVGAGVGGEPKRCLLRAFQHPDNNWPR